MTHDDTQQEHEETRNEQGLPESGPGSRSTPPSNPEVETGEEDKGREKLDKIVNW